MPAESSTNTRKWVALAGLAAAPIAAFAFLKWMQSRDARPQSRELPADTEQWTTADVQQWLRTLQLTPEAVEAFRLSGVDGQTLPLLREEHLREMGITKVGDKLKLTTGLQALLAEGERAAPTVSPKKGPAPRSAPTNEASQEHMKAVTRLQGIFSVLGSEQFKAAPRDAQLEVLSESEAELGRVLPILQSFPGDQKATILSAADSLRQRIAAAKRGLQLGMEARPDARPASDVNWKDVVQGIRESLGSLNAVINSTEAQAGSDAQREALLKAVLEQLAKVKEVCSSLPEDDAAEIRQQLQRTEAAAVSRLGRSRSSTGASQVADSPLQQPVVRLRQIFDALRALPQQASSEQELREGLRTLRGEVHRVKASLSGKHDLQPEERQMVLSMADQILSAVDKTEEMISANQEAETSTPLQVEPQERQSHGHHHGHHHRHHGHKHGSETVEEVPTFSAPALMAILNNIVMALQEPSKEKRPQDRLRELEKLHTSLQQLEPSLEALPPSDRRDVEPIFTKLKQYFDLLLAEKEHPAHRGTSATASRQQQSAAAAAKETPTAQGVVQELQSLYTAFNSPDFLSAPPAQQLQLILQAEQRLAQCKEVITTFSPDNQEALEPLRASLEQMVRGLHGALNRELGPAAPEARNIAPARSPAKDREARPSPRAAVREVFDSLTAMQDLLRSDEAKSAARVERHKLASSVLAQVEKALSFARAVGGEQEVELQQLCSAVVEDARSLMNEAEDSSETKVTSEVLATLKGMASLISSENFRQQSPSRRGAIAANLHARIQEMKPVVAALPAPQRDVLNEQLELVDSVLRAARSASSGHERQPTGGSNQGTQQAALVAQRLKHLFSVISSSEFENADAANQAELLDLVEQQLVTLAGECQTLPGDLRTELIQGIQTLEGVVQTLRTRVVTANPSHPAGDDLLRRAAAAAEAMEAGKITSTDQLKPLMEILEELDSAPMRTERNLAIRKRFQQALGRTIDRLSSQADNGVGADEDEGEEAEDQEEEEEMEDEDGEQVEGDADPNGRADNQQEAASRDDASQDVQGFVTDLVELAQNARARNQDPEGLSEMMTQLEEMLERASASGIEWRSSPQIVELVRTILENIQGAQDQVNEDNAVNTERTINEATQQLRTAAPNLRSVEDLSPWLRLLDGLTSMQDTLGVRELRALQEFQQEILLCSRKIRDRAVAEVDAAGYSVDSVAEGSTTAPPPTRKATRSPGLRSGQRDPEEEAE